MKRIAMMACVVLGLALTASQSHASWSEACYSGYQPWYNIFAKRYKGITPEEERLQKFWHDYYDAMKNYYGALDHIDWVAYYKNHGYQINGCCGGPGCGGCARVNYAPVVVSPNMMWCVPNGPLNGPPCGPSACPPSCPPAQGPATYQAGYTPGYNPGYAPGYGQLPPAQGGYQP